MKAAGNRHGNSIAFAGVMGGRLIGGVEQGSYHDADN